MKIVVAANERLYHFFSAYAPQTGCSDQAKKEFWSLLDEKTAEVPPKDVIIVAGDLNGQINGTEPARTSVFKYLGSAIASDGGLMVEVNSRVSTAWSKWCSLTGVLCDKKIPERFKSKIYRAVIRQVSMYGDEDAALDGWVTRMNRVRNEDIRQKFDVAPIADWGKEDSVRMIGLELEVSGKRPRGRPKQRWSDTLHTDMKVTDVHPD
ncbi:unnamed protein product [Heligmosomoides polygyrus]|uniref:Endo/exonuclease/phosphatase domain-containing protein n=1 Tax=Heligmosomoides polygyrus TaxID=6339 RepID=A0A183G3T5_HELPZ|nr:unnamed protein product [Heligmosomoides polygyrus]